MSRPTDSENMDPPLQPSNPDNTPAMITPAASRRGGGSIKVDSELGAQPPGSPSGLDSLAIEDALNKEMDDGKTGKLVTKLTLTDGIDEEAESSSSWNSGSEGDTSDDDVAASGKPERGGRKKKVTSEKDGELGATDAISCAVVQSNGRTSPLNEFPGAPKTPHRRAQASIIGGGGGGAPAYAAAEGGALASRGIALASPGPGITTPLQLLRSSKFETPERTQSAENAMPAARGAAATPFQTRVTGRAASSADGSRVRTHATPKPTPHRQLAGVAAEGNFESYSSPGKNPETGDLLVDIGESFAAEIEPLMKNGIQLAKDMAGKDLVMFVGLTGAGKSVATNFANDVAMQAALVEGKRQVEVNTKQRGNGSSIARIGTGAVSMTKLIEVHVRPPQDDDDDEDQEEPLALVDTQGLVDTSGAGADDTSGAGADLVNFVTLNEVAKHCKTIRLVLVINWSTIVMDRGTKLRELCHALVGLLGDPHDDGIDIRHMFLLVTQVPETLGKSDVTVEHVRAQFNKIAKEIKAEEEKLGRVDNISCFIEKVFMKLASKDMRKATTPTMILTNQLHLYDNDGEIEKNPTTMFRHLIRERKANESPAETLNLTFSAASIKEINCICQKLKDNAQLAIDRDQPEIVVEVIEEIAKLNSLLGPCVDSIRFLKDAVEDIQKRFAEKMTDMRELAVRSFDAQSKGSEEFESTTLQGMLQVWKTLAKLIPLVESGSLPSTMPRADSVRSVVMNAAKIEIGRIDDVLRNRSTSKPETIAPITISLSNLKKLDDLSRSAGCSITTTLANLGVNEDEGERGLLNSGAAVVTIFADSVAEKLDDVNVATALTGNGALVLVKSIDSLASLPHLPIAASQQLATLNTKVRTNFIFKLKECSRKVHEWAASLSPDEGTGGQPSSESPNLKNELAFLSQIAEDSSLSVHFGVDPKKFYEAALSACSLAFDRINGPHASSGTHTERDAQLLSDLASTSNCSTLRQQFDSVLEQLRTKANTNLALVKDYLAGNADDLTKYANAGALGDRLDQLREQSWLDQPQFCPMVKIKEYVKEAEDATEKRLEDMTKIECNSCKEWHAVSVQLLRFRIIGAHAEQVYRDHGSRWAKWMRGQVSNALKEIKNVTDYNLTVPRVQDKRFLANEAFQSIELVLVDIYFIDEHDSVGEDMQNSATESTHEIQRALEDYLKPWITRLEDPVTDLEAAPSHLEDIISIVNSILPNTQHKNCRKLFASGNAEGSSSDLVDDIKSQVGHFRDELLELLEQNAPGGRSPDVLMGALESMREFLKTKRSFFKGSVWADTDKVIKDLKKQINQKFGELQVLTRECTNKAITQSLEAISALVNQTGNINLKVIEQGCKFITLENCSNGEEFKKVCLELAANVPDLAEFTLDAEDEQQSYADFEMFQGRVSALKCIHSSLPKGTKEMLKTHHSMDIDAMFEIEEGGILHQFSDFVERWKEHVQAAIKDDCNFAVADHAMVVFKKICRGRKPCLLKDWLKAQHAECDAPAVGATCTYLLKVACFAEPLHDKLKTVGEDLANLALVIKDASKITALSTVQSVALVTIVSNQLDLVAKPPDRSLTTRAQDKARAEFWKKEVSSMTEKICNVMENCSQEQGVYLASSLSFRDAGLKPKRYNDIGKDLCNAICVLKGNCDIDVQKKVATAIQKWDRLTEEFTVWSKQEEKRQMGTLAYKRKNNFEAFAEEVEAIRTKVESASEKTEAMMAAEVFDQTQIAQANRLRSEVDGIPEECNAELPKPLTTYKQEMDNQVATRCKKLVCAIEAQITSNAAQASETVASLSAVLLYDGFNDGSSSSIAEAAVQATTKSVVAHLSEAKQVLDLVSTCLSKDAPANIEKLKLAVSALSHSSALVKATMALADGKKAAYEGLVEQRRKGLEDDVHNAKDKVAELVDRELSLKEKLKVESESILDLEEKVSALESNSADTAAKGAAATTEVTRCNGIVQTKTVELEKAEHAKRAASGTSKAAKAKAKTLTKAVTDSKRSLKAAKTKLEEAKEDLNTLQKELADESTSANDELTQLHDNVARHRTSKDGFEKQLADLQKSLSEEKNKIATAETAVQELDEPSAFAKLEKCVAATNAASVCLVVENFITRLFEDCDALWDMRGHISLGEGAIDRLAEIFSKTTTNDVKQVVQLLNGASQTKLNAMIAEKVGWASHRIAELFRDGKAALEGSSSGAETVMISYKVLRAFEHIQTPPPVYAFVDLIHSEIKAKQQVAEDLIKSWKQDENPLDLCKYVTEVLVNLQELHDSGPTFHEKIETAIANVLGCFETLAATPGKHTRPTIPTLYETLDESGPAGKTVCSFPVFNGMRNLKFIINTSGQDNAYAVKNCYGEDTGIPDDVDQTVLAKAMEDHDAKYNEYLRRFLKDGTDMNGLIDAVKKLVPKPPKTQAGIAAWASASWKQLFSDSEHQHVRRDWVKKVLKQLPSILAGVFAAWSILSSGDCYESSRKTRSHKESLATMKRPQPSQVLGIFRLLGAGSKKQDCCMDSHLAEIETGEGKSVTLGVMSIILALLGQDVDCVCYSEDLSRRDYEGFEMVFEAFEVTSFIRYGTFEALAEKLGNAGGRKTDATRSLIFKNGASKAGVQAEDKRPKTLLVDEVDQLLNPKVYGSLHRFATKVRTPAISKLIRHIYMKNLVAKDLTALQDDPVFQAVEGELEDAILYAAVAGMLLCRETFADHEYVARDGRIGYTHHDGVNFDMSFGYHTAFAYLKEAATGTEISDETAAENLFISVRCGEFSYAKIPEHYLRVLGVTGTLFDHKTRTLRLSPADRKIVEDEFQITKFTKVPSIFGTKTRVFREITDVHFKEDADEWYGKVKEEIDARLYDNDGGVRAVLVFFDNKSKLDAFVESKFGQDLYAIPSVKTQQITEETEYAKKNQRIARASRTSTVTLMTRQLARGTDFFCLDDAVLKSGGLHVIQTFWSVDKSEFIQAMGRCGRQGQPGSYSMVLCKSHLERLGFEKENIATWIASGDLFSKLEEDSLRICEQANLSRPDNATRCSKSHAETLDFYSKVDQFNSKDANTGIMGKLLKFAGAAPQQVEVSKRDLLSFLRQRNPRPSTGEPTRVLIALDGTGSMGGAIGKTKATIGVMLNRLDIILQKATEDDVEYVVQIVVYRNFNAYTSSELLQVSPWTNAPALLEEFLETVEAMYGYSDEAVELALVHAQLQKANLVIVIGDADAQTLTGFNGAETKRREFETHPWFTDPQFATVTYFEPEARALAAPKYDCPIAAFFIPTYKSAVPPGFQMMADAHADGSAQLLDVENEETGAKDLTDAVCKQVLSKIGGEAFVAMYEQATFAN